MSGEGVDVLGDFEEGEGGRPHVTTVRGSVHVWGWTVGNRSFERGEQTVAGETAQVSQVAQRSVGEGRLRREEVREGFLSVESDVDQDPVSHVEN